LSIASLSNSFVPHVNVGVRQYSSTIFSSLSSRPFRVVNSQLSSSADETSSSSSSSSSSYNIPNEWKGQILEGLSTIIDPDFNRDIVTLGFIHNLSFDETTRQVSFDVQLTTPACPIKDLFQTQCQEQVDALPWTNGKAIVTMTAPPPKEANEVAAGTPLGVAQVKNIIAVSSCKGGVGKSTTAVNLAYSLSNLGASVGIFDADVYGPSLPTMVTPDNDAVTFVGRQIAPLSRNGVKLMSFGYVNEGSAIMRGPMITQLLDQFLSLTYWGPLDYLILDMPPGTGDIQLTLSQKLNITAAVIVTTPQELSFVDVERGIEMFDSVNVPCVSVVENMAYLELDDDDEKDEQKVVFDEKLMKNAFMETLKNNGLEDATMIDETSNNLLNIVQESLAKVQQAQQVKEKKQVKIFGQGHKKRLSEQWGIEHTYSIPLMTKLAKNGDSGIPFVLEYPDSPQSAIFKELASSVVREVVKLQFSQENSRPTVNFNQEDHILQFEIDGKTEKIPPAELRRDCKCAACVEEMTGKQILKPEDISDSVKPINMTPTGNYALSVDWSDGHRSLYPYRQIRSLLQEKKEDKAAESTAKEAVSI